MAGFGLEVKQVVRRPRSGHVSHSPDAVFSDDQIVDAAYEHFRQEGFPYRDLSKYQCMQVVNKLSKTDNLSLYRTTVAYVVADTYHPHRFHGRYRDSKLSPKDSFEQDDEWMRKCLEKSLELVGEIKEKSVLGFHGTAVSGIKGLANFRPGFALLQYRKYCKPGGVVLDPCTGYGGRLVGWMASQSSRYIGIDPNTKVYAGNTRMAKDFGRSKDVELHCCPAEDLDLDKVKGRCDFSFTSPPYFRAEIYSEEETQSCNRYQEAKQWRNNFLLPFMRLQFTALKPGCISCVNIADVKISGKMVPLVKWCIKAGEKVGFEYLGRDVYNLKRHFGAGGEENKSAPRTEAVLKFRRT